MAATKSNNMVLLKDMHPMMRNVNCEVIVLQRAEVDPQVMTRDGSMIYKFTVADRTGSILLNVWEEANGQYVRSGDILRIIGVDCKIRKGHLQLTTSRAGKVKRIGQDTFLFAEKPNFSERVSQSDSASGEVGAGDTAAGPVINPARPPPHSQQNRPLATRGGGARGGGRGGRGNWRGFGPRRDLDKMDTMDTGAGRGYRPPPATADGAAQRDPRRKRPFEKAEEGPGGRRTRPKVEYNELE